MVKKLKKAGVSNTEIIAITRHKSEDSLKHYDEVDIDDHRRISKCIRVKKLWKFQIITLNVLVQFHPTLRLATHHQPMVGSGLLIHCSYPSYPPPPLSTNPLQSTISVGAQYTLEAMIHVHMNVEDPLSQDNVVLVVSHLQNMPSISCTYTMQSCVCKLLLNISWM